jgi:hypothetical protein
LGISGHNSNNYCLPPLATFFSFFTGCAPGLRGGIGGIRLAGSTGGRTADFLGMASYNALLAREAQARKSWRNLRFEYKAERRPVHVTLIGLASLFLLGRSKKILNPGCPYRLSNEDRMFWLSADRDKTMATQDYCLFVHQPTNRHSAIWAVEISRRAVPGADREKILPVIAEPENDFAGQRTDPLAIRKLNNQRLTHNVLRSTHSAPPI